MPNKREYWGYHLVMDMSGCDECINNPNVVRNFIKDLVHTLDMHPIGAPVVYYVDTEEGKGVSAVQIITTSTITFHGDDNGKAVYLDVFSCKVYNLDDVINLVKKYFNPKAYKHRLLTRNAPENSITT